MEVKQRETLVLLTSLQALNPSPLCLSCQMLPSAEAQSQRQDLFLLTVYTNKETHSYITLVYDAEHQKLMLNGLSYKIFFLPVKTKAALC